MRLSGFCCGGGGGGWLVCVYSPVCLAFGRWPAFFAGVLWCVLTVLLAVNTRGPLVFWLEFKSSGQPGRGGSRHFFAFVFQSGLPSCRVVSYRFGLVHSSSCRGKSSFRT